MRFSFRHAAALVALGLFGALGASARAAKLPATFVLTSVEANKRVGDWSASGGSYPGTGQWSVRQRVLHGGVQEGTEVIEVQSGDLNFAVVPTRGMSLSEARRGSVRLGWKSPVRQLVNPAFVNLDTRGGLGWLDGFNEWMVRCGVEWAGHPGLDGGRMLSLHGKIGNIPASEVVVVVERSAEGAARIRIRGRVDEVSMFGAALELWTEVSTVVGSNVIRIEDSLKNLGSAEQEYQIIYHSNYGAPLLEAGARLEAAVKELRPLDGVAAGAMDSYAVYKGPMAGFREEVFGARLYGDAEGRSTVMLRNAAADKAVAITYSTHELPYFVLWKNTGGENDAYVTGLEPATGYPANRSIERAAGRVPKLQPGEQRRFALDFALLQGRQEVADSNARIDALRKGQPTQFDPTPIKPAN